MTFDDGIIDIYSLENIADKGDQPKYDLIYKSSYYFSYKTLGLTRYYTALANNEKIENVVTIYQDRKIKTSDIVKFDDGTFYEIKLIQHTTDENGIKISNLSLERYNNECCYKT